MNNNKSLDDKIEDELAGFPMPNLLRMAYGASVMYFALSIDEAVNVKNTDFYNIGKEVIVATFVGTIAACLEKPVYRTVNKIYKAIKK